MKIRTLKAMFKPRSIAVIGHGIEIDAAAATLLTNLIDAGFQGPVLPVNPKRHAVSGVLAYPDVMSLPEAPDLAIITTPLHKSPTVISALGDKGTQAILLLSQETLTSQDDCSNTLKRTLLTAAEPYGMRLLGPDRLGIAIPINNINASLDRTPVKAGHLSLLTQSSSVMRAVTQWASHHAAGFSHMVSLGSGVDVGFSDMLDYLAQDPHTHAILMYLEQVHQPRQFISAARVAARSKPVIVLKPRSFGNHPREEGIYDAAARRAGMLWVDSIEHLLNAAETLTHTQPVRQNRMFILGNSRSMGLLASDRLIREGGILATVNETTLNALAELVSPHCRAENPMDLGDHAGFKEYIKALDLLRKERYIDGILIVHVPTSTELDDESHQAVGERVAKGRLVMVSWIGALSARAVHCFREAGIAIYRTPDEAVRSFLHIAEYWRNQELLMETPSSVPEEFTPNTEAAHQIVTAALAAGKDRLNIQATSELLAAYQIPKVVTQFASTPEEAAELASKLHCSVALKIVSRSIRNRSDVGGVALALDGHHEVLTTGTAMLRRVRTLAPEAVLEGFAVQPMLPRRGAYEVAIGVRTGRDFQAGPVLFFGHGGTETHVINDIAYALPPLNMHLAKELISRTRLSTLLSGSPGRSVNINALALTLVKVSQMVIDLAELVELDINPLWVNTDGILAISASIRIAQASCPANQRLAIHPYPKELEQPLTLKDDKTLLLRPILPEDEPAFQAMLRRIPSYDIRMRFLRPLKELPREMAAHLTQLDYDRDMAFVLAEPGVAGKAEIWGMVSMHADPDRETAEYAIVLDRALQGQGLGYLMMEKIIEHARKLGIQELFGAVLEENKSMLRINRALDFKIQPEPDDPELMHVSLKL